MPGNFHHDVVGGGAAVVVESRQSLKARRARGKNFYVALKAIGAYRVSAFFHFFFLAKPHLRGNIRTGGGERARFAATALILGNRGTDQFVHHFHRLIGFHRRMTRVVVHVTRTRNAFELHTFFHQVFVNIEQSTARKYFFEFVFLQLIHARAARDDHGLDVEIVQCIGDAVKQHPIVGDDFLTFIGVARCGLRIAAAQIARRQYRLHAKVIKHRLCRQAHLPKQTL